MKRRPIASDMLLNNLVFSAHQYSPSIQKENCVLEFEVANKRSILLHWLLRSRNLLCFVISITLSKRKRYMMKLLVCSQFLKFISAFAVCFSVWIHRNFSDQNVKFNSAIEIIVKRMTVVNTWQPNWFYNVLNSSKNMISSYLNKSAIYVNISLCALLIEFPTISDSCTFNQSLTSCEWWNHKLTSYREICHISIH